MKTLQILAAAALLGTLAGSAAAEDKVSRLIGSTTLSIPNFKPSWQPIPTYGSIRTWYDGTGFQMAMSDTTPHNSVGWLESPLFTVPAATGQEVGNISVMTVNFSFTGVYAGAAPEMRVRFHTADNTQFATGSVTSARFAELKTGGTGQLQVIFDRRNFTTDRQMWCFIDLISVTGAGNADANFYFRVNNVTIDHYAPASASSDANRVSASLLETDGDVAVYPNGSTDRRRIFRNADGYAADGSYAVVIQDGDLYAFDGPNDFNEILVAEPGNVVSAAVSDEHVMWVEDDDELRYFNIKTGAKFRVGDDKDFIGVVPQGNGSFVAVARDLDNEGERSFYMYDTNTASPTLRGLSDDETGVFVNVGSTGVVSLNKSGNYDVLSGAWFTTN